MKNDYFADGSIQQIIKTPASVTADSQTAGIDIRDYKGDCMVVATLLNTAGTTPTMDVAIQAANDGDVVDTVDYTGTGNGTITEVEGGPDAVAEDITITMSGATQGAVVGSVSGSLGTATVGTKFTSSKISFLLTAGSVAFVNLDAFTVGMLARTYADVLTFTQVTTGASVQKKKLNIDKVGRFIRGDFDIAGTDNPAYTIGVALYGMKN